MNDEFLMDDLDDDKTVGAATKAAFAEKIEALP